MELRRVAIDTSKSVVALHGVDAAGEAWPRREVPRGKLPGFFAGLPPTDVALAACGGSHHSGRGRARPGHRARLIPPQDVKPFVKRGKTDRNDAAAICEAAARPGLRAVPVTAAETQAALLLLGMRRLPACRRSRAVNALRGPAAEIGGGSGGGVAGPGGGDAGVAGGADRGAGRADRCPR